MFNLIISIIAIALVVVLAGASLYYGGSAFNQGNADAKAATLINQAQQIQSAANLYTATEGGKPEDISKVMPSYLSANPKIPVGENGSFEWKFVDSSDVTAVTTAPDAAGLYISITPNMEDGITRDICKKINRDGAGVVFCTAGGPSLVEIKAGGSSDSEIDAVIGDGNKAIVSMMF